MQVTEFRPVWDSTEGGATVLLSGSLQPGAPQQAQTGQLWLMWGDTQVSCNTVASSAS